jgi:post-segregation antitoxin (ccd killing protein)
MTHTYEELKHKPLAELREIAAGITHEAVQGYTQLNKDHLLVALCKALGIEMHAHKEIKGIDKAATKAMIKDWQKKRDEALAARDRKALKAAMDQIHQLKRKMRKATVKSPVRPVPAA